MAAKVFVSGIYTSWANMKERCLNKKYVGYHRYGGRGITICDKWLKFDNFAKDMASSWGKGLTLERINNNGNYEPSNCKWANRKQQALNTANVERARRYSFNGLLLTTREWSEKLGINRTTLDMRLRDYKWPLSKRLYQE